MIGEINEQEMVEFFEKWSDEKQCLEAVKKNGNALKYVKDRKIFKKIIKNKGIGER